MDDRGFRPWLVTLVICVGTAVALVVWVNASGGYANVPWFLAVGICVGATLACLWLIVRSLLGWSWVHEDAPPSQRGLVVDDDVAAYRGWLATPDSLTATVGPLLRRILADRLRRDHNLDLDVDTDRVREVVTPRLLAVALDGRSISTADLPGLLDDLDAVASRTDSERAPEVGPDRAPHKERLSL